MKSICFFATYFTSERIPYYIKVYIPELKKQFTEVIFLCSQKTLQKEDLQFLETQQVKLQVEANEGFDFGLWYKAFQKCEIEGYDRIALVNDSCILFKPLDEFMNWSIRDHSDVQGITASDSISFHLQSYFLILNKPAISLTKKYFEEHKILKNISDVIRQYEVGLCKYFLSKGLKLSAFIDNDGYSGEFSPYYQCIRYHLSRGVPLIKKKILFSSYRKDELFTLARMNFDIRVNTYIEIIEKQNQNLVLSFSKLLKSESNKMNSFDRIKYNSLRILIKLKRKLKS